MKKFFQGVAAAAMALFITLSGGCGSSISVKSQDSTYKNSALLVGTAELAATLDSATNQVVIDVRSNAAYGTSGHIRNAVNLAPATFDKGGAGIDSTDLKTPADIAAILGNAGISINTKIVICGQNVDPNAGRVFWMLESLGAKDVHILDGGYDKWVSDGYPTVTTVPTPTATTFVPAVDDSKLATKATVQANYDAPGYAVVDSRNAVDYNTGHIPNAVNILTSEFLNADGTVRSHGDIKALLDGKGVTSGKSVITHCYVGYRSGQEYFILRLMGYDVSNYDGSWTEWNADPALPKASCPNGNLLVSGDSLAANIDNANQVVIDVRSSADYAAGHLKHAVNLAPATFDMDGTSDLKSPAEISAILGAAGISGGKRIVVYGKGVDASAGRVFWMLEYSGAADVHVLDGGYDKWVADGRETVTTATSVPAATFVAGQDGSRIANSAQVLAHYADTANYAVVDSRNSADFDAKHIPNAINILTGDFLNGDGTVKNYTDLKTLLDGKGITAGKKVITHCYVGYRSGQEYLVFRLMGFSVVNYDGSWSAWSADPTLPTLP